MHARLARAFLAVKIGSNAKLIHDRLTASNLLAERVTSVERPHYLEAIV